MFLKKSVLGVIRQQDEKQYNPYQNIVNLLKSSNLFNKQQNCQSDIIQQIQNFHNFYNMRYQQSKANFEKINKQNKEYAEKLIKYEQLLQNYQLMHHQAKQKMMFLDKRLKDVQIQSQNKTLQFSRLINQKQQQLQQFRAQISKNFLKHEISKKKVVKIKDKSIKLDNQQSTVIQTSRNQRLIGNLKQQIQNYQNQLEQQTRQNQMLRKKLKHLQADRKYENQRLKNATLSLQLDLKMKNQQVERLNNQLQIYEKKFEQLLQKLKSNNCKQQTQRDKYSVSDSLRSQSFNIRFQDNQNSYMTSGDQRQALKTCRNYDNQVTQKKVRKNHKRYGSSNLQQLGPKQVQKQNINMKIKIYKYNKNKKYP